MTTQTRFYYSRSKFQANLLIAAALTAMVCGFAWMILGIYGSVHATLYTSIVGLVFFAFMSARMLQQYIQDKVVLAVQPTGLMDARWSSEPVEWERIKDISISQREYGFILSVWLWPHGNVRDLHSAGAEPTFTIDLEPLQGDPSQIVSLISQYKPVRPEQ